MTNKAMQYCKEAKAMLVDAAEQEKSADDLKWEAVERIYRAHAEEGTSKREIGRAVALNESTIRKYILVWEKFGAAGRPQRPTFTEAQAEIDPTKENAAREERGARAVLSDPDRAAKVLDTVDPEAKAHVVKHVAKSDKGAMTSAMTDPKARMRAEGASSRAREIARTEAKNERKAAAGRSGGTPDLGAAALFAIGNLMSDGAAWAGRLSDAYEEALRVCSDDQIEAIKGRVRTGSFPIVKVLGDITGEGMDDALAKMLDNTEA